MCGIGGIVLPSVRYSLDDNPSNCFELNNSLQPIVNALKHRGPDDSGVFVDQPNGVGLAHTRLAILDLTPAGRQPMTTPDGRYTIVFNGEIYNFRTLRDELIRAGQRFTSHSDTEVVLQLYALHGPAALSKLSGMYAFGIWDRHEKSLFLARDPLGIKPLYYWQAGQKLAFASEIRAVLAANLGDRDIDRPALLNYFMYGSVQEPQTLIQNVRMLPAGHTLLWKQGNCTTNMFWSLEFGNRNVSIEDSIQATRAALNDTIRRHFVSDVPVGIFLSGGIDSTALLALAHANGVANVKTFCIGFEDSQFDEGSDAARTAHHFHSDHHEWRMSAADGASLVDGFLQSMDQPSNDGFNVYSVSKFARDNGMKVVLSGIGGDELFGSYPSFRRVPQLVSIHRIASAVPGGAQVAASVLGSISPTAMGRRLRDFFQSDGGFAIAYRTMRGIFTPAEAQRIIQQLTGGNIADASTSTDQFNFLKQLPPRDAVSYLETTVYMRNQILRDGDVFSMAHGLELRVPLVDRELFDVVTRIPSKKRHARGKRLLLDAVPEIPSWIANAPKRAFRFPFERWMREHWKPTFDQLVASSPVPLDTWYRKWTMFTLNHFLKSNQLSTAASS